MTVKEIRDLFLDYIDEPLAAPWGGEMVKVNTILQQAYGSVVDYITVKCKWYYLTESTVTVNPGDKVITMPTGFIVLEKITDVSLDKDLKRYVPPAPRLIATGRPRFFWEYDKNNFNIYPLPDTVYSYRVKYRYKPVWPPDVTKDLSNDGLPVTFPEDHELLIAQKASILAAAKLRDGTEEISNRKALFDTDMQFLLDSINFNPQNVAHSAIKGF